MPILYLTSCTNYLDRDASFWVLRICQETLEVPHFTQFETEVGHTVMLFQETEMPFHESSNIVRIMR